MGTRAETLGTLLTRLRAEVGHSLNVAVGVNMRDHLIHILQRTQDELYMGHDWPFLRLDVTVSLAPSQTTFSVPADMDPARISRIFIAYDAGSPWSVLPFMQFPQDAAGLEATEPPGRPLSWHMSFDAATNTEFLRIRPPPDQTYQLLVRGTRKLLPFVEDNDRSTLDGTLIVLAAAAEVLLRQKAEDAAAKQTRAQAYLRRLKGELDANRRGVFMVGGGPRLSRLRPYIDFIPS